MLTRHDEDPFDTGSQNRTPKFWKAAYVILGSYNMGNYAAYKPLFNIIGGNTPKPLSPVGNIW